VIVPRPLGAAHVPDHRWGRAVEAWWGAGLDRLDGAVIGQALQRDAFARARLPPETTRLKRSGADARAAEAAGPRVTVGESRAHRPALPPRLWGRTVTAEGGPVWGHGTEGHRRASPEPRCQIPPRRPHRPDVAASLVGADRTGCAGETRARAAAHRCRLVTWVPPTVGLRHLVGEAPALRERPRRWAQPGRRHGARAQDRGASGSRPSRGQSAAGEAQA
jgi:hypothetical protein